MVIMNEEKDRSASLKADTAKKTCPRAARENAKKTEVYVKKPAHTGLKFHFDKKKLITHEFAFNSVSKTEKVTRCRHIDKSLDRQNNTESSYSADSKKIEVLMDTLKISKSEECSSREKSPLRKEIPKSPVVERLTSKKACTRCSRCSKTPKEEKPETKTVKITKDQDSSLKITKKEDHTTKTVKVIPQFMKTTESKKQYSKLAKPLVEPQEKVLKPKCILIHSEKPALLDNVKNDASRNCEAPQSPKPMTPKKHCSKLAKLLAEPQEKNLNAKFSIEYTEKSVSKNCEKSLSNADKFHCANEKKVEFAWPTSGAPENTIVINSETFDRDPTDKGKPEIFNGTEHPAESDTIACLLNGRHDEHLCDPHHGLESPSGSKASKIPRKTPGTIGLKPEASLDKDMMSQLIEL